MFLLTGVVGIVSAVLCLVSCVLCLVLCFLCFISLMILMPCVLRRVACVHCNHSSIFYVLCFFMCGGHCLLCLVSCVLCSVFCVVFYEACGLCLLQPLCLISRVSRVICVLCRVFLLLCLLYYCWCTVVLPSLGGCVVRHATLTNSHTPSTHIRLEIVFFIAESGTNMTRPA
jgi:hypothetical protein